MAHNQPWFRPAVPLLGTVDIELLAEPLCRVVCGKLLHLLAEVSFTDANVYPSPLDDDISCLITVVTLHVFIWE
jgi:hypothetical protein